MSSVILERVEVENLRGYFNASLSLHRSRTLLVGPNNSGKTSILRLLDWALNRFEVDHIGPNLPLTDDDCNFLLPARDTRHRARRLRLVVHITDGRRWRKFDCDENGKAIIRFNVRLTPDRIAYLGLGEAKRAEASVTDLVASELLMEVRRSLHFVHIPSFRDARSKQFNSTLQDALRTRIDKKVLHASQAGAPKEHREVSKALESLRKIMLKLARPIWDDVRDALPPGMARDAKLELDLELAELVRILESKLNLRISTGAHDSLAVEMTELGSGLQSLLDLVVQETKMPIGIKVLIALEEPEAFLHPAAQRTVTSRLLSGVGDARKVVVTTHSPIVVDEARYGDVVLCRNHQFYESEDVTADLREEINTALLSGFGAEMIFGSAVLLVEGEGDRQFFERLRRRLARHDGGGHLDRCFVVPVGGKGRFAPWIRLLESYGTPQDRPIRWLVAADSDASVETRKAFADSGVTIALEVLEEMSRITTEKNGGDVNKWRSAVKIANDKCRSTAAKLHFLELDLEEAALSEAGHQLLANISKLMKWTDSPKKDEVLKRLGSKGFGGVDGKKDVYVRGYIGQHISPSELSPNIERCLERWFGLALPDAAALRKILSDWRKRAV